MAPFVAVCGRAHSGKDAFARAFIDRNYRAEKLAAPLKASMLAFFPHMRSDHVDGDLKDVVDEVTQTTPRALMQVIGTNLMQHGVQSAFPAIGRCVFVNALLTRLRDCPSQGECGTIVTDLRFEHERTKLVSCANAYVVKIVRSQGAGAGDAHESESGIATELCDTIVVNDGDLVDLYSKASDIHDALSAGRRPPRYV
jgi:hypothetical protein